MTLTLFAQALGKKSRKMELSDSRMVTKRCKAMMMVKTQQSSGSQERPLLRRVIMKSKTVSPAITAMRVVRKR